LYGGAYFRIRDIQLQVSLGLLLLPAKYEYSERGTD